MGDPHPIILFDGLCPVCNRLNLFVLQRDPSAHFRFAPLQSAFAQQVLIRHRALPIDLDTMYVLAEPDTPRERLLQRADAVLYVLQALGQGWRALATVLRLAPGPLRNAAYNAIARNRYCLGRHESCVMPRPEWRDRFIEVG